MIKSIWKPIYNKSKIIYYNLFEYLKLENKKGTTAFKVIWTCDNEKCKNPNKTHSISACHLIKPKMNLDKQICHSCQISGKGNGRYGDNRKWNDFFDEDKLEKMKEMFSEKWKGDKNPSIRDDIKIKKNQVIINELYLEKVVNEKNFKLLDILSIKGKNSKIRIQCKNNHITEKTYSSFMVKTKKFICEKCFYESIQLNLSDEEIKKWKQYDKMVRTLTARTYRTYKSVINPNNLPIGRGKHHIDHKFSISEGYKKNIPPQIISSKENLEVITESENCSKQNKCSITYDELINKTKYLLIKQNK
jgi:hypothetical protein